MINYRISHKTTYMYTAPVSMCHNKGHLTPRDHPFQSCRFANFSIDPEPCLFYHRTDFFGNRVTFLAVQKPHERLVVSVKSEVSVSIKEYPTPEETLRWDIVREQLKGDLSDHCLAAAEFVYDSPHVRRSQELADYARLSFTKGRPLVEATRDLNSRIYKDFKYAPHSTSISTPISVVMRQRKGVCQDFAHLMIGCLRSIGLAARYVSGYLRTLPPPGKPRLVGADASHAWVAVFLPGVGWLDFDPTNNSTPSGSHITLAWGRDFDDVSPLRGVILGGGNQTVSVSVDVAPADEEAAPTPRTSPSPLPPARSPNAATTSPDPQKSA